MECNPSPFFNNLVACGKYHLQEDTGDRVGAISLYQFDKDNGTLDLHCSIERAGVLDCRWDFSGMNIITAEADGKVGLFHLNEEDSSLSFASEYKQESGSITLAVDWNVLSPGYAISSFSDGKIVKLDCSTSNIQEQVSFIGHEGAEVWAIAASKFSPNLFYSGGDDCKLKSWDDRMELNSSSPVASKRYDMGVTCIQSSMFNEHQIVVGSYDETVSIWDHRNLRRSLSEVKVGGGVWRVKMNPYNPSIILTACMYNEFQLVKVHDDGMKLSKWGEVFGSPQHELGKLAYGADWFRFGEGVQYVALCSFYDKVCSCWSVDLNKGQVL